MNNEKAQAISLEVIRVLKYRFSSFPNEHSALRNAPFHEAFLEAFSDRINAAGVDVHTLLSMSAWLHGLNTTLGQSFFENVAHILCDGEKRAFSGNSIFSEQVSAISEIMTDLKNANCLPDTVRENAIIAKNAYGGRVSASAFTVDCFAVSDSDVLAIELKSVRPNSGEMRGEKQKILHAKAVLATLFPERNILYYVGFPFDPLADIETEYCKRRFIDNTIELGKFFAPEEILLASELWSTLSGEHDTMNEILTLIRDIATVEFQSEFSFISNPLRVQQSPVEYLRIAQKWHLLYETRIAQALCDKAFATTPTTVRNLNKQVFNDSGAYNQSRASILLSAI